LLSTKCFPSLVPGQTHVKVSKDTSFNLASAEQSLVQAAVALPFVHLQTALP